MSDESTQPEPTTADLQARAAQAVDRFNSSADPAVRTAARRELESTLTELRRRGGDRSRSDDVDARTASSLVERWAKSAGIKTGTDAARGERQTDPPTKPSDKPAQTLSGAAPTQGYSAPSHGKISFTGDSVRAMDAARCELCDYLRTRPGPGADLKERGEWESGRIKRLRALILAEEEFIKNVASHHVPYTEGDMKILDEGYEALKPIRDKLDKIADNDDRAATYRKNMADAAVIHEGVKQALVGAPTRSDQYKGAKKAAGETKKLGALADADALDKMVKHAEKLPNKGKAADTIKSIRKATAGLDKAAGSAAKSLGKAGGAGGELGQAVVGAFGGLNRLAYQENERALIELSKQKQEMVDVIFDAQTKLADAHAKVIERRQDAALEHVNQVLADEGKPPLRLHTMPTDTLREAELDAWVEELHLSGPIDRRDGAGKNQRPARSVGNFRRKHGVPFDSSAEAALLKFCDEHCKQPAKKVGAAALGGGLVVGGILIAAGIWALTNDAVDEELVAAPAVVAETVPDTASQNAPASVQPTTPEAPPATSESVPVTVADSEPSTIPATTLWPDPIVFGSPCAVVTHSPNERFPLSPSWNALSWVAFDADGNPVLAGPVDEAPQPPDDGAGLVTVDAPGADVPMIEVPLTQHPDGLFWMVETVMPISSFGDYSVRVTDDAGTLLSDPYEFTVGPDEGPVAGCQPASGRTVPPDAGGPPAVIVDDEGAIPPPDDDLAPYREFLTRWDAAHRDGDVEALLGWVDPTFIDLYGVEQCRTYLEGVVGSASGVFLIDGQPDDDWVYEDGATSLEVPGTWEVDAEMILGGDPTRVSLHLRDGPDGVTWFTDCGEPGG